MNAEETISRLKKAAEGKRQREQEARQDAIKKVADEHHDPMLTRMVRPESHKDKRQEAS